MSNLVTYYTLIEAGCLIAALIFLRHEQGSVWGIQRWYLCLVLLGELCALYCIWVLGHPSNQWIHNLMIPAIALFVGQMTFAAVAELDGTRRSWLYAWWGIVAAVYLTEAAINGGLPEYLRYTRLFVNVSISAGCFYYFIRLMRTNTARDLRTLPEFWWIYGTSCFFFGQSIANHYVQLLAVTKTTIAGASLHMILYIILISLLYGLWSYAFYLRSKRRSLAISSS
ncbi:hypothetical protein ACFOET_05835 [Parapedobacter deserti]|uniref:Uncharacterized protein n=1 Tax=Parapedobacter deserti TaxID=1912957 RepID=A0ABV7JLE1_9SPHI